MFRVLIVIPLLLYFLYLCENMHAMKYINIALFLLLLVSCTTKQEAEENIVSVTIEPQRYFAEKIAGDKFKIHTVVPAGQSPETYDPTPQQMVGIGKSVAYLRIGYIGFEQAWMEKIRANNSQMQMFDTSEGLELLTEMAEHDHHDHEESAKHRHEHHHHPGGIDPHIWSSITGAKVVAWNTLQALISLDKENTQYYWKNYNKLVEEIEQTERTISDLLKPVLSRAFIIYHPALTYFAEEFNLTQLTIEMDGKEPSPAQLKELIDLSRNYNVRIVFIQQEFDQKNAELIARETNCRIVRINPLAYEWSKEMIHIAKSLADE